MTSADPLANRIEDVRAAHRVLAARLERASGSGRRVLEEPVPLQSEPEVLAWLATRRAGDRMCFLDRPANTVVAGVGVFDCVSTIDDVTAGEAPILGTWRFDPSQTPAPEWAAFGEGRFVLPRVYVRGTISTEGSRNSGFVLGVVFDAGNAADRASAVEHLLPPTTALVIDASPPALPVAEDTTPDFEQWSRAVDRALVAFENDEAQKIVLARRTRAQLSTSLDAVETLARWRENEPEGYAFLHEVPATKDAPTSAFFGVTPELLWRRNGAEIQLEAVAGTRRRGTTSDDDARLARSLLEDDKELREHSVVRRFIEQKIPNARVPNTAGEIPNVRKLAHVQHLVTPLVATGVSRTTLKELAPTPAVCGTPRDRAFGLVADLEPFDRGLYAGAIGAMSADGEAFAVGIRSVLVRGNEAYLFAGAGLVPGSIAAHEWREIKQKERGARTALFGAALDADPENSRRDEEKPLGAPAGSAKSAGRAA